MSMRKKVTLAVCKISMILLMAVTMPLAGCSPQGEGLDKSQTAMADKMSEIVKRSGGDWQKLTDADKKYLVGLANGDEQAAQMSFRAQTGQLRIAKPPSGPPRGPMGGPGGPPHGPMGGPMGGPR